MWGTQNAFSTSSLIKKGCILVPKGVEGKWRKKKQPYFFWSNINTLSSVYFIQSSPSKRLIRLFVWEHGVHISDMFLVFSSTKKYREKKTVLCWEHCQREPPPSWVGMWFSRDKSQNRSNTPSVDGICSSIFVWLHSNNTTNRFISAYVLLEVCQTFPMHL